MATMVAFAVPYCGVENLPNLIKCLPAPPADGVTFAAVGGLPSGMKFRVESDGLYLVRPGMLIIVK